MLPINTSSHVVFGSGAGKRFVYQGGNYPQLPPTNDPGNEKCFILPPNFPPNLNILTAYFFIMALFPSEIVEQHLIKELFRFISFFLKAGD